MALIWDFWREIGSSAVSTGGTAHYYDESAQSIYPDSSLVTRIGKVSEGHWPETVFGEPVTISETEYTDLAIDHPCNGTLHAAAISEGVLYYMRYVYALDISDILEDGSLKAQADNCITQMTLNIQNTGPYLFTSDMTLFDPGAKMELSFAVGEEEPYPAGICYLDEVAYDEYAQTVALSGRNTAGYFLSAQTFDTAAMLSGGRSEVVKHIFDIAGVDGVLIQNDLSHLSVSVLPSDVLLSFLNDVLAAAGWRLAERADGVIVVGGDTFIARYIQNSSYVFNGGSEVFSRRTTKNADAAYTQVAVSQKKTGLTVIEQVGHWRNWALGGHKTKHYTASDEMTLSEIQNLAKSLSESMRLVGITEQFASPLRPQLLVGDIAEIWYDDVSHAGRLGLITEVTHSFGLGGFRTDFNIDSGGVIMESEEYPLVSRSAVLDGYNRGLRMSDIMSRIADKRVMVTPAGGGSAPQSVNAEAPSVSPASIMRIV